GRGSWGEAPEEIVVKLVGDVGNWKIVAHIAFKFYSVASETFSTGSTFAMSGRLHRAVRGRLTERRQNLRYTILPVEHAYFEAQILLKIAHRRLVRRCEARTKK